MATLTRRQLLHRWILLPLASLPLLHGCDRNSTVLCADPDLLSRGEEAMRKTLEYVPISAVVQQQCAGCEFFSVADAQSCGECEILNGPVNSRGHCTSWAGRS